MFKKVVLFFLVRDQKIGVNGSRAAYFPNAPVGRIVRSTHIFYIRLP